MIQKLTDAFPVWVVLGGILALVWPASFEWFGGRWIPLGLAIIMLGMGLTLGPEDFKEVARRPGLVFLGVCLQYSVMPFLGFIIAKIFGLPDILAAGLILVACCPGGTASNVVAYLAKADVALSVAMTSVSTLLAALITPILTTLLVGNRVEVDPMGLFWSTVQVVILPVALGVLLNHFFHKRVEGLQKISPLIAVIFITLIVGAILSRGREQILESGLQLVGAVLALHTAGFCLGYGLSRLFGPVHQARTISIEVGMQNSGLGAVLARKNFTDPATAIPSAISSVFHSVIGSLLAAWWKRR